MKKKFKKTQLSKKERAGIENLYRFEEMKKTETSENENETMKDEVIEMDNEKMFDLSVQPTEEIKKESRAEFNDEGTSYIVDLTTRQTQYCSMKAETEEEKGLLFNATNNSDMRLADCINMTIKVKDVFVEAVNCTNSETGEMTVCPRIVLIDENNVGYQCVSIGIFSAIKKLFGVYGEPMRWKAPIPMIVKQITKGERKMLTLNVDVVNN